LSRLLRRDPTVPPAHPSGLLRNRSRATAIAPRQSVLSSGIARLKYAPNQALQATFLVLTRTITNTSN
jgi:hypothetical protein